MIYFKLVIPLIFEIPLFFDSPCTCAGLAQFWEWWEAGAVGAVGAGLGEYQLLEGGY